MAPSSTATRRTKERVPKPNQKAQLLRSRAQGFREGAFLTASLQGPRLAEVAQRPLVVGDGAAHEAHGVFQGSVLSGGTACRRAWRFSKVALVRA